jgi:chromosome segregation ATPase
MDINLHVFIHEADEAEIRRVDRKLDSILHAITRLAAQETQLMADVASVKQLVADINDETNTIAGKVDAQTAKIEALKAQIAAGSGVTAQDLDDIAAGLTPISDRLKAIGADPDAPIPVTSRR